MDRRTPRHHGGNIEAGSGPGGEVGLVALARRGDRRAFDSLFRAHRDVVFGLAARLTNDEDLAEEVLLEVFTAAWQGLPTFRGESRFSTWICSIAVNRSRQAVRARKRRWRRRGPPAALASAAVEREAPVETAIDLERAIAELPRGAREVLLLRHVVGLSCRETASLLGVSEGTVKSQASRACALLRERLSNE